MSIKSVRSAAELVFPVPDFDRILILAPHTDDGEMGCGGTIAKFVVNGMNVMYVAFSSADKSLPKKFPPGTLKKELIAATQALGLRRNNVVCLDYEVRKFSERRQDILEEMFELKSSFDPDVVFAPSLNDLHQDHRTVAEECRRMFKMKTILGYEMPWNNISFDTLSFSVLQRSHIRKKIEALECYRSQKRRKYMNAEFVESLARTRGVQIATRYAEAFEVVRWVI